MKRLKGAITEKQLKQKLELEAARHYSSRSDWAKSHNIAPQVVYSFMVRSQGAGLQIPRALGYEPVVVYVPIKGKKS